MMNKVVLKLVMGAALLVMAGCSMFRDMGTSEPLREVPVVLASGRSFEDIVLKAAARRGWTAQRLSEREWELSIHQRDNVCVVHVVQDSGCSFSIIPTESNISVAKCDQWVNNLKRAIINLSAD